MSLACFTLAQLCLLYKQKLYFGNKGGLAEINTHNTCTKLIESRQMSAVIQILTTDKIVVIVCQRWTVCLLKYFFY